MLCVTQLRVSDWMYDSCLCVQWGGSSGIPWENPSMLLTGTERGTLCLLDMRAPAAKKACTLFVPGSPVSSVCFAGGSGILYSAGNKVKLFDPRKQTFEASLVYSSDVISHISWQNRTQRVAASDESGLIHITSLRKDLSPVPAQLTHSNNLPCTGVQFRSNTTNEFLSVGLDANIKKWKIGPATTQTTTKLRSAENCLMFVNPPLIHSLCTASHSNCRATLHGCSSLAAVACHDGTVRIIDVDIEHHVYSSRRKFPSLLAGLSQIVVGQHKEAASCVCFARFASGDLLVSGGNDRQIFVWNWYEAAHKGVNTVTGIKICCKLNSVCTTSRASSASIAAAHTSASVSIYSVTN
mmetsp:Transcript_19481/g.66236  ORF Transcript_19481/g.66236 Transcript_19481/m.66236 type:complete len:353 (+) Transcript_19481:74-1132(+)